jgi:hypothetical protein
MRRGESPDGENSDDAEALDPLPMPPQNATMDQLRTVCPSYYHPL